MKVITALGNPGSQYAKTRHNIGFMTADYLAQKYSEKFNTNTKFNADICKINIGAETILLYKPLTYMNLSGQAVRAVMAYYKLQVEDLFVIYDDIALDLGKIRFRAKGSSGGHNGVKSIITEVKSDGFHRLKIGIGPQPKFVKSESFVLANFPKESEELLEETIKFSSDAVEFYLNNDIQKAQNKYN